MGTAEPSGGGSREEINEPDWNEGCSAYGKKPGEECSDCLYQRAFFGYVLEDGVWVKE